MVDTHLGKKSVPLWLWNMLKPLRYLFLKHPDEGMSVLTISVPLLHLLMMLTRCIFQCNFSSYSSCVVDNVFAAAADVLCAAFDAQIGVYMADKGTSISKILFCSFAQNFYFCSGRVIEHLCKTRDVGAGAEVASIAQHRLAEAHAPTDRMRA